MKILFSSLVLLLSFFALQQLPLKISNVSVDKYQTELPHYVNGKLDEIYHFEADLEHKIFSSAYVKIIPDDCVESISINGINIPISEIKGRCDWIDGFKIDVEPYLVNSTNTISLDIKNRDGRAGLNILPIHDYKSLSYMILVSIMFIALMILVIDILLHLKFSWELIVLLLMGLFLRIVYLSYTNYDERTFDVITATGHLDYIKIIANDFILPNPTGGWEYHQPPLYYAVSAFFYKLASVSNLVNPLVLLQILSLVQFFIFLIYSIKILNITLTKRELIFIASLFIIFWPSGVIHSIRLGNDVLLYMFFAISIYYLILWQQLKKPLWVALLYASLALITKSNGVILFGIIFIVILVEMLYQKEYKVFFKNTLLIGVFFILAFGINFIDNIYYAMQMENQDWLVGNVVNRINGQLFVSNSLVNYIYFDFKTYLFEPYIDNWNDEYGRQYFWNFLFKSSLFSEFFFNTSYQRTIAVVNSFLSLGIFTYIFVAIVTLNKKERLSSLVFLLILALSLIVLLAYRIKIPVSCNTDFRYIFPILISMAYFYALALKKSKEKGLVLIERFGYFQIIIFSILSILFFLI